VVCALERTLTRDLAEPPRQECFRQAVDSSPVLSAFPSATDLLAHLHSLKSAGGTHPADRILTELFRVAPRNGRPGILRDFLLLAFIPTLHSTSRQVAAGYPSLSIDDIAQNAVVSLLQILGSEEFRHRKSHVAFAVSRTLKRSAFAWAARECRFAVHRAQREAFLEAALHVDRAEPIERTALLRHFLDSCHRRGWLSQWELDLLNDFKLDATSNERRGGRTTVYSNADRQRMKRLLAKLRRLAQRPPDGGQGGTQLLLF